jgi:hypothetical protein
MMPEKEGMPQKFTDLSKLISYLENEKPNVRIHNTSKLAPFKLDWKQVSIEASPSGKPLGFWYAFGTEWLKWCMSEMPHWIGRYVYEVEVEVSDYPTTNKVLSTNPEWLQQKFGYVRDNDTNKYRYSAELYDFYAKIAWDELAKQVAGIEFPRYNRYASERLMWYYSWDVASGCVWSSSAVKKITLLADLDTEETRKGGRKPNIQL